MKNEYIVDDNLNVLRQIKGCSVDFVYIDPPFGKNRDFDDFDDRWNDIPLFVNEFLHPRIKEVHRILSRKGSVCVHCDISASHYIKVMMDSVFGYNKLINEIIWKTGGNSKTKKKMYKSHDTILAYSKTAEYTFNPIYKPYGEEYFKKNNPKMCEIRNEYYSSCAIHNSQPEVVKRPNLRYEWNGHFKQWLVSEEKMKYLHKDNRLTYSKTGIPRIKRYLNEMEGVPITDVWLDISTIQNGEKLDYATQKPIKLVERIISMFSNEGDLVLDCFAGSGTTGIAAIRTRRNFTLIDKNIKGKKIFDKRFRETKGKIVVKNTKKKKVDKVSAFFQAKPRSIIKKKG